MQLALHIEPSRVEKALRELLYQMSCLQYLLLLYERDNLIVQVLWQHVLYKVQRFLSVFAIRADTYPVSCRQIV